MVVGVDKFYDFEDCMESLKQFGGSDKKESIFFNDKRYMVKFNDPIPEDKRNDMTSSSRNNAFSEYISCHIFETLDIPVQKTLLGHRHNRIVVACEDFCVNGYDINEFEKNNSNLDVNFKDIHYPDIEDVITFIRMDKRIDSNLNEKRFWDTFVVDSVLGNFDRHTGNWGYLYNDEKHETVLAPVYDCGSCLYPMLNDAGMEDVIVSQKKIDERIFIYPKAAFTYNGEKVSYFEFMTNTDILHKFPILQESIVEIREKISRDTVNRIIENTPELSHIRMVFYQTMIQERCEKLLIPSYKVAKKTVVSFNESQAIRPISRKRR